MYSCIAKLRVIQLANEALKEQGEIFEAGAKGNFVSEAAKLCVLIANRHVDDSQQQEICGLKDEIFTLKTDIEVQKRLRRELAEQKDITIEDLRKAQENLTTALRQRNDEIEALNTSRSSETSK